MMSDNMKILSADNVGFSYPGYPPVLSGFSAVPVFRRSSLRHRSFRVRKINHAESGRRVFNSGFRRNQ